MKICVVGNSHLAALKLGWDELAGQYGDKVELVFFGSPATSLAKGVAANGSCLYVTDPQLKKTIITISGGMTEIRFADFDAVFVTGLACKFEHLFDTLKTHKTYDSPLPQDTFYKMISAACLTQVCMDKQKNVALFRLVSLIRSASNIPIFLSPCPLPSKACVEVNPFLLANTTQAVQQGFYQGLSNLCKHYSAVLLTQPENTVTDYIFTKPRFSKGAVRFNLKSLCDDADYAHMNREYGKEVLAHHLPVICRW